MPSEASVLQEKHREPTSGFSTSHAAGFVDLDQEVSVDRLPVQGKFSEWLSGTLLRTAPCKFDLGRQTVSHWFDGLAMLLITGSGIGIGEAIARGLAAEGVTVAVHGRDQERGARVAQYIAAAGGKAVVVLGDLTSDADVARMADEAEQLLGGVDILIHNAGGSGAKQIWENTPASDWAAAYDRNVLAAVRITNILLPKMRAAKWGRVVNVSSLAGTLPPATGPDYSACKAAMNNMTMSLSKSAAGDGVTVNAISPGTIFTPNLEAAFRKMAASNGWADDQAAWAVIEQAVLPHVVQVPVGSVGKVDDIAAAVAFLCSPLAGYITGVDLRIDGGVMPAL
jgi:3-oxoacyl-[acyl-carrier protein] reductase